MIEDYINGYIQRSQGGSYDGRITIDGILLPAISAVFFKDGDSNYLWLKRKKVLDYDFESQTYKEREAKPQWEVYLKKQLKSDTVAYKGEFFFMHFKYSIAGVWDKVLGTDKQRLNLFVERLPMSQQTIINSINESKKKMTEEEIRHKLEENEHTTMKCVCDMLLNYEGKIRTYLADFVASLCSVDKGSMFSENNSLDVAQARWLFWYAYRYMTNETYEKIGKLSGELYGKTFTKVGVAASVNKMYTLIEQQPIWRKRWTIIKRIIKLQNEMIDEPQIPIAITIPKNVELTIKKE